MSLAVVALIDGCFVVAGGLVEVFLVDTPQHPVGTADPVEALHDHHEMAAGRVSS